MNGGDVAPLRERGQVDEEDLVEAPLAHHLRRQLVDVVRGGDDEHRAGLLLQPGDEAAEHARRGARVRVVRGAGAGEALLQLVDPEDGRRDRLRHLDRAAHVLLGAADDPREDLADVESQQGQPPRGAHRLRGQRLAAAGDPDHENALRPRQPELARLLAERALPLAQPALEHVEAADVVHLLLRAEELQHAALADDALLLGEDDVDVEPAAGLHQRLGEHALRLVGGQPKRRLDHVLAVLAGRDLRAGVARDAVEDGVDLGKLRQGVFDDRDFLVELRRDREQRRDEEDGLQLLLQLAADVAEEPDDLRVFEIRVQVAEDEHGALVGLRLDDEAQRLERIAGIALRLLPQPDAFGDAPGVDLRPIVLLPLAGLQHVGDALFDALLLAGEDVDQRVTRPHQVLDVLVDPPQLRLALHVLRDLTRLAGQRHGRGVSRLHRRGERIGLDRFHGVEKASTRPPGRANQRASAARLRTRGNSVILRLARHWRYGRSVDFSAHQAPMALQRLKDHGGFNGDRIESCAIPTVFAGGSDWLRTVVEKSDLAEGNLAGARIRETTFAHTTLRKARLRGSRLERVELYFCDLNELDAGQLAARRVKFHGCEAMNAVFSGAQIAVARFEDTKLYRARFDGALIVRTVFADSRLGAASMEKADFSGARLVDVSLRGANLMGASFARATLIGVDLRDAALTGADFTGATTIGCHLPVEPLS